MSPHSHRLEHPIATAAAPPALAAGAVGILTGMNTYLAFGVAMLVIVVVSLVASGMLAASFNERAKADLGRALAPLAERLDGTVDVEAASISGRYRGHITTGAMVSAPGGMGRQFEVRLVDGAGGRPWNLLSTRPKDDSGPIEHRFEGGDGLEQPLRGALDASMERLLPFPGWFQLRYDPLAGDLRLSRTMQSRKDIPSEERFALYLDTLYTAATANRAAQAPDAAT